MHLVINVLSSKPTLFLTEILSCISTCKCNILELRSSNLAMAAVAAYLLVEGNWNHLAKLQHNLENLQKRLDIKICVLQIEVEQSKDTYIPYTLQTIGIEQPNLIQEIVSFLRRYQIEVVEIKARSYAAVYHQTQLFSSKMTLLIPPEIQLLSFREEVFMFCDTLNMDAIFEPLKW